MDPSNLEDQLSGSSSSFSTPSSHFHGATGSHEWNHPENLILNTDKFNFNINTEVVSTPKDLTTTIVEDLGLQWPYNTDQSTHQVDYFPKNKEVQAVSFIKFLDFVKDPSVLYTNQFDSPNDDKTHILPSDEAQSLPAGFVLPTNNFSSSSQTTGYQSSDLLASDSNLALVREFESYGMRCLQRRPDQEPPENHIPDQTKNQVHVMKRGGNNPTDQSSSASSLQTKRPRINPKSSFSPFKVSKIKKS